jgi:hypothetical protein
MYFEDLSEYRYNGRFALPGVLAVGWLTASQPHEQGDISSALGDKTAVLAATKPVNQARGFHRCDLCAAQGKPGGEISVSISGVERVLGSAEVWIPGKGLLFASPDLIVHYIREHRYLPPKPYLDALGDLDLANWDPPKDWGLDLYRASLAKPTTL